MVTKNTIKIFSGSNKDEVEKNINEFLQGISADRVVDIKFSTGATEGINGYFNVLVQYTDF